MEASGGGRSSSTKARGAAADTSLQNFHRGKPRLVYSTGETPEPIGHFSLESTRSWRSERLQKFGPRDSSVESSRLSVHSINLAPVNIRALAPHPPLQAAQKSSTSVRRKLAKEVLDLSESLEDSAVETPSASAHQIAIYKKRIKAANERALVYKKKLERARELLLEFKKKLENAQRTEPKGGSGGGSGGAGNKGERPLSATSNIYHNITIYANNSVNNNSIQMGGGSSSSKSSGE